MRRRTADGTPWPRQFCAMDSTTRGSSRTLRNWPRSQRASLPLRRISSRRVCSMSPVPSSSATGAKRSNSARRWSTSRTRCPSGVT
ncbi:Uncharacterised protein [Bordetella pertussis]|nr:Uncharacterised protein [Bordetella pertussis]